MTTANEILVSQLDDVLSIPLECVHTEGSVTFVYKKNGGDAIKQEVKLGAMNDNATVVLEGVTEKDELLLSSPAEPEKLKFVMLTASK